MLKVAQIKKEVRNGFDLVTEFIIFGSPGRKSNSRIYVNDSFILGKSAQKYVNIFEKQIKRIKGMLPIPMDNKSYLWLFEIWYSDVRSDVSVELVFDLLQKYGVVTNDVTIRNYLVLGETLDRELPRVEVAVFKPK